MINVFSRFVLLMRERKILKNLVVRNLKIKYMDTMLGFMWAFLQPLLTILILNFVFSQLMRFNIERYPLFLCAGVLPWTFFSKALMEATASLVNNSNVILKTNFPLEVLPTSYCLSNVIEFIIALCVLLPIIYAFGISISPHIFIMIFPIIVLHFLFVLGFVLFLSVSHVFYKDIGHLLSIVLMFWFYLTPIFYSLEHIPEQYRTFLRFNPMVIFVEGYRSILFNNAIPPLGAYGMMALIAVISWYVGWTVFLYKEKDVIKEL